MSYTEYKKSKEWVKDEVNAKLASIRNNLGDSNLVTYGAKVINDRLKKDPMRYRDYGAYWWAVKRLLNMRGYKYGDIDNPIMREFYSGDAPIESLVMAENFRDEYLKSNIIYTNEFMLNNESSDTTVIIDDDMEFLAQSML